MGPCEQNGSAALPVGATLSPAVCSRLPGFDATTPVDYPGVGACPSVSRLLQWTPAR